MAIRAIQEPAGNLEAVKETILADPGIVEQGLFVLDAHLRAGTGGLIDLLAVDGSRALALLEFMRDGEDDLLSRALEHQGWVRTQIHFLRHLYGPDRIHPFRRPRGILLSPGYSPAFLRKVSELPAPLTPLVYRFEANGNGPHLHLEPALLPARPPKPIPPPSRRPADLAAFAERFTPEQLAAGIRRNGRRRTCPPVPGYDIAGLNLPCRTVGGDTYDFLARSGNRLWVVVADVAGKGLSAALIMSHFRAMLRGLAERDRPVGQLVGKLNDILSRALPVNEFISFFVLELEPEPGVVRYVNAGHNPPLLLRAGGEVERFEGSGPVLGVLPGIFYEARETRMQPGEALLLYTDGAVESQNPEQEEFGEGRLLDSLRGVVPLESKQGLTRIEESILGFCGSAHRHDDITLLLVRRLGS